MYNEHIPAFKITLLLGFGNICIAVNILLHYNITNQICHSIFLRKTITNINNKINPINNTIRTTLDAPGPWEPSNVNSKWPATILAANRIDSVIGRIILLTVSIITIIGIKAGGVPKGTKCANKLLYWNTIEYNIEPNQMGNASTNVIDKCLVLVKIYGINPMKLEKIMKKKIETKI